ncbi:MAG: hypothetical protein GY928_23675 [Colwellia sp.]|nr:hypothetical protein [Colwellia sp.]
MTLNQHIESIKKFFVDNFYNGQNIIVYGQGFSCLTTDNGVIPKIVTNGVGVGNLLPTNANSHMFFFAEDGQTITDNVSMFECDVNLYFSLDLDNLGLTETDHGSRIDAVNKRIIDLIDNTQLVLNTATLRTNKQAFSDFDGVDGSFYQAPHYLIKVSTNLQYNIN